MVRSLEEYEAWLSLMEQRKAQIKELYLQGKSQHRIARIIGISQPGVRKHLINMKLLAPTTPPQRDGQDGSSGIPLVLSTKEGEFIKVSSDLFGFSQGIEIARCKHCKGFFITRHPGQLFCCNRCGVSRPCTCGSAQRARVVIS